MPTMEFALTAGLLGANEKDLIDVLRLIGISICRLSEIVVFDKSGGNPERSAISQGVARQKPPLGFGEVGGITRQAASLSKSPIPGGPMVLRDAWRFSADATFD